MAVAGIFLILRSLQNSVGLRKARLHIHGRRRDLPEVLLFFHSMGIPVREGYGMTECTGFSFSAAEGDVRLGTVGRPIPGLEFRIEEDGELLKTGEAVFPGITAIRRPPRVSSGGWLHTGDVAQLDPGGHLRIIDRKKAIIITSGERTCRLPSSRTRSALPLHQGGRGPRRGGEIPGGADPDRFREYRAVGDCAAAAGHAFLGLFLAAGRGAGSYFRESGSG